MTHRLGTGAEAIHIAQRLKDPRKLKILGVLVESFEYSGFRFLNFNQIAQRAEIGASLVRRPVRALARKGLAVYSSGLFNEDGQVAGSGYAATALGHVVFEILEKGTKANDER